MPSLGDIAGVFSLALQFFDGLIGRHKDNKNHDIKNGIAEIENSLDIVRANGFDSLKQDKKQELLEKIEKEKELIVNHTDFFGRHRLHGKMKRKAIELAKELEELGVMNNPNDSDIFSQKAAALVLSIRDETHYRRSA